MPYNSGGLDEHKLNAVVNHEPYFVEHRFLDERLPVELQRSGQVQRWERVKELGSGSYGVVWLERLQSGRETGPTVRAVKTVQKAKMNDERELTALSDFSTRRASDSTFEISQPCPHDANVGFTFSARSLRIFCRIIWLVSRSDDDLYSHGVLSWRHTQALDPSQSASAGERGADDRGTAAPWFGTHARPRLCPSRSQARCKYQNWSNLSRQVLIGPLEHIHRHTRTRMVSQDRRLRNIQTDQESWHGISNWNRHAHLHSSRDPG